MSPFFELNIGAKIPSVGLGTWRADHGLIGDALATAIKHYCLSRQGRPSGKCSHRSSQPYQH
ncbi:hypothetical protein CK203_074920 [Vitis vinifera]|uniref:NADPH-dependent aldo-keto reductase, chloroplastic n=1 Tax=Vitis vinifera TaxID=29760 RepID=A0A438DE90_VITVI|nr:hypothetical protein CK203_074920 [Vitis vinifera]